MAGKVVFITGGTSGIGLALAEAFIATGDNVAVCARSQGSLDAFVAAHPGALGVKADVTKIADQAAALDAVAARFGRLDILVNNAGHMVERDFAAGVTDAAGLDHDIRLNLTSPIQITAAALARWPKLDAVIFVSSGYAMVSPRSSPTYGAGKHGVHGFAEALRRQLAGSGTHVLEVLPPLVDTPAVAHKGGKKISAAEVARVTLDALKRKKKLALPGAVRMLPALMRLAPGMVGRTVGNG